MFLIFAITALGVLISVVLPLLRAKLPIPKTRNEIDFQDYVKTYLIVGLFSLLTAALILAFLYSGGTQLTFQDDWPNALLAGYAWDSTLQKITQKD